MRSADRGAPFPRPPGAGQPAAAAWCRLLPELQLPCDPSSRSSTGTQDTCTDFLYLVLYPVYIGSSPCHKGAIVRYMWAVTQHPAQFVCSTVGVLTPGEVFPKPARVTLHRGGRRLLSFHSRGPDGFGHDQPSAISARVPFAYIPDSPCMHERIPSATVGRASSVEWLQKTCIVSSGYVVLVTQPVCPSDGSPPRPFLPAATIM